MAKRTATTTQTVFVTLDTNIIIRTISQGMPGCEIEHWQELRVLVEANKVGLVIPEVVLLELRKLWATFESA
jgi:rRNA-processing protein FCF1